jgi:uncharacterized protein YecE (DUF72 family)
MANKVYIGTSGWHYKHWVGTYYPEGTKPAGQLPLYIKDFKTVELNNPFYRLPSKDTFVNWRKAVPADFLFSVKASRFITHMKKLKEPKEALHEFLNHASGLKEKLGPVLFQLPPHWQLNLERLEAFLKLLPKKYRYVFEFRNETWFDPAVIKLLKAHNCAFCIYELNGFITALEVTADFVYVRLHGPGAKYQGSYSSQTLKQWARRCQQWLRQEKDVFVYFDNDQAGYAAFNAQTLLKLLAG